MGDNNQQEAIDLDAIDDNNGADLLEAIYRRRGYDYPDVPFRLVIPSSVTVIDDYACMECVMLIEVVFHNKVTEIGRQAFQRCFNLRRVELLEGLLRVERDAFYKCTSLREIVIPASVQYMEDLVFDRCESLQTVVFAPRTTSIELGSQLFRGCTDLRFVTLPQQNLRSIPEGLFEGCLSLTHLQLPESVEEIEVRAFRGSGLRSVTLFENVHRIRRRAFEDCAFLERVIIYSTTITLATDIFVKCPLLSVIMMAPWLWPTLFVSMNEHPEFIFKFFRHYSTQIFDGGGGALSTANENGINRVVTHDDDNEDNNGNRNRRDIEDGHNRWCWWCEWWR